MVFLIALVTKEQFFILVLPVANTASTKDTNGNIGIIAAEVAPIRLVPSLLLGSAILARRSLLFVGGIYGICLLVGIFGICNLSLHVTRTSPSSWRRSGLFSLVLISSVLLLLVVVVVVAMLFGCTSDMRFV